MANLLDQASIVLTPTAYDNGKVLCAKPSEAPYGDFDFSRNSAATRVNAQGLVENVQILSSNLVQNGDFSEEGAEEVSNGSFSQEGVQLVTNGSFDTDSDWNKGAGWSISGGKAICDGTNSVYLYQSLAGTTTNDVFKITYTISNYISGSVAVGFGSGLNQPLGTQRNADGTYTEYLTKSSTSTSFGFKSASFKGSIDNVSVREVGQDWVLNGWEISENKATCDASGGALTMQQQGVLTSGKTYKITYTILDYVQGVLRFRSSPVSGDYTSGNGEHTFYIVAQNATFGLQGLNGFIGSITNISVKEVGMDWIVGSDWSIAENKAVSSGSGNNLQQTINISSNKTYKLTFDVISTSGTLFFDLGGATAKTLTDSGSKEYYFQSVNTNNLRFYGSAYYGEITNISVIEITDDTNLPRINYEGFSYQDALGSEQVVNGDFEDGSANWVQASSSITISGGGANFDGTLSTSNVRQLNIVESAKQYKVTYTVRDYVQGLSAIRLGAYTTFQSGNGTFTEVITSTSIDLQIYGLSSFIGSIDNVSVKEYLGQEVVPNSGCGSWLFEPQSTNVIPYSEDFSQWTLYQIDTPIANQGISPNGNNEATKITTSTSKVKSVVYQSSTISGNITRSVFAKKGSADFMFFDVPSSDAGAWFNLSNGQLGTINSGTATIEDYGNGWYRCSCTANWTSYTFAIGLSDADNSTAITGGKDILIWGAQTEALSYTTSYIPTNGEPNGVTRNQDVCTNGGSLATINSTEGVLYFEGSALALTSSLEMLSLNDGTYNNIVLFRYYDTSSNDIQVQVKVGGSLQASILFTLSDAKAFNKIALKYKENDFALWVNGAKVGTDTSGTTFPADTLNELSFNRGDGGNPLYGKTKALAVWKEALSDSELQSLTTI